MADAGKAASVAAISVVKVLLITATIGAFGFAVLNSLGPAWSWWGKSQAQAPVDAGPGSCPPMPRDPHVANFAAPFYPGVEAQQGVAEYQRERFRELEAQLSARPLTCEAQAEPLDQLLWMHRVAEPQERTLLARELYLCGAGHTAWRHLPSPPLTGCDNSDWCHHPRCESAHEDCARKLIAFPPGGCLHASGRYWLGAHVCARHLTGRATEKDVRELGADWCLNREALAEAQRLRSLGVTPYPLEATE
jgi:hypothetical protein